MPIHDWTRVDAGIFHAFHHGWVHELSKVFNRGLLPSDYYSLAEWKPDDVGRDAFTPEAAESELEYYSRKQKVIGVHRTADDALVAIIEIVSLGNKAGRKAFRAFVEKAAELLDQGIHLLIIDVQLRTKRDPQSIHGVIWEELSGQEYVAPTDKPFTLAAYESAEVVRAYVVHAGLGEALADMPLFLEPQQTVTVPLEATYNAAIAEVPRRWRQVLEVTN